MFVVDAGAVKVTHVVMWCHWHFVTTDVASYYAQLIFA